MKSLLLFIFLLLLTGCSQAHIQTAWTRTKDASYTAISDPVTWAPLAMGGTLYVTRTDDGITQHIMKHPIINSTNDDIYREINGIETYATALFIDDNDSLIKLKRVGVETLGFVSAKETTEILNANIKKETPLKNDDFAIGSHHSTDTFAGSSMNRRNVDQLSIPTWGKYSLNTLSYLSASASTLAGVQEGVHSVGDQFVNLSIGNFIGLFVHDLFMKEDTHINLSIQKDQTNISASWKF